MLMKHEESILIRVNEKIKPSSNYYVWHFALPEIYKKTN